MLKRKLSEEEIIQENKKIKKIDKICMYCKESSNYYLITTRCSSFDLSKL
jgi:hypothetical protein